MSVKTRGKSKTPLSGRAPEGAHRRINEGARERERSQQTARPKGEQKRGDVMLIQGISEDGEALAVLRAREDRLEAGIVRTVKEGELGDGEVVKLKPRPESPLVCDVEVQVPQNALNSRGGSDVHHGPAQVATRTYRENWDAIWKKPAGKKSSLPN